MTRILLNRRRNSRQILQATMGVLLLDLSGRAYKMTVGTPSSYEQAIVMDALNYIETEYKTASLADFCDRQGKPDYYISRLMKRYFSLYIYPVSAEAPSFAGRLSSDRNKRTDRSHHRGYRL